LIIIVSKT